MIIDNKFQFWTPLQRPMPSANTFKLLKDLYDVNARLLRMLSRIGIRTSDIDSINLGNDGSGSIDEEDF